MEDKILETYRIDNSEQAAALLNPLRGEILAKLFEPASASEVARQIGEPAQRINYHIKALEKVGLVRRVGSRQVRNLVEVLYLAIAKTFVLADTLGLHADLAARLRDQNSLAHLVNVSDRIRRDALTLLERSETEAEVPSAAIQTSVQLKSAEQRNAFVTEYLSLVKQLVQKYESSESVSEHEYNVVLAVYPKTE